MVWKVVALLEDKKVEMLALQKALLEQTDIVPVLADFQFIETEQGLVVTNPPEKLDAGALASMAAELDAERN